jgi:adenosine/AMP kinase
METRIVAIEKPEDVNLILGQAHFIKTVEDIHEALTCSVPGIRFGLAFCEASGPRLVRFSGNDAELTELAKNHTLKIGAGHSFLIFMRNAFPVNLLPRLKDVPEVCRIFCATANPVQVIIGETDQGRAILGVVDGEAPLGIEEKEQIEERKRFLRNIGYKVS